MDDSPNSARDWLTVAADDMSMLERALVSPVVSVGACFHAQQVIEKCFKAVAAFRGAPEVPFTHSLVALYRLMRAMGADCPVDEGQLLPLEPYAVRVRYRPVAVPTEAAASAAAELARAIYRWAEELVNQG